MESVSSSSETPEFSGFELTCAVQKYHWGKRGTTSEVALLARENSQLGIEDMECYAELWMGTHPNGPSVIAGTDRTLASYIESSPECLGSSIKQFKTNLPFLLKVLSINKPLSIQAHPTKAHAIELNKSQPEIYKDPNHKPELALALTPFEALLGFRKVEELKTFFQTVPELAQVIGEENVSAFLEAEDPAGALKECFTSLMTAKSQKVEDALACLLKRLNLTDEATRKAQFASLVERLHEGYPGDVGVFGPYIFNYIQLKPGEAIYLPANEPHAYLSGDCIECMACSDNVVRAGLTPKMKDVETLCSMLTYDSGSPESKIFKPAIEDDYTMIFSPPVLDFALAQISVPSGINEYTLKVRETASILIVIRGMAEGGGGKVCLKRGTVLFIPAKAELVLTSINNITIYQAFCNVLAALQ